MKKPNSVAELANAVEVFMECQVFEKRSVSGAQKMKDNNRAQHLSVAKPGSLRFDPAQLRACSQKYSQYRAKRVFDVADWGLLCVVED